VLGASSSVRCISNCVQSRRRVIYGVGLALGGALCWAGTVVCVRRSLRARDFYAPFFATYFSTSFTLLVYPVYVVFRLVVARVNVSAREITRYRPTPSHVLQTYTVVSSPNLSVYLSSTYDRICKLPKLLFSVADAEIQIGGGTDKSLSTSAFRPFLTPSASPL